MSPSHRRVVYSGICMCGHYYHKHHLGMVARPEIAKLIGDYIVAECLFFGFNENGGQDEDGNLHCGKYVDSEDPDEFVRKSWRGTSR